MIISAADLTVGLSVGVSFSDRNIGRKVFEYIMQCGLLRLAVVNLQLILLNHTGAFLLPLQANVPCLVNQAANAVIFYPSIINV